MKKRIWILLLAALMILGVPLSASAAQLGSYVCDEAQLLSNDEFVDLEDRARSISEKYGTGVYVVIVPDFRDYGSTPQECAQRYYIDSGFGYGEEYNGIQLLLSVNNRDYSLWGHGSYANTALTSRGREDMEEDFLAEFKHDNWKSGFDAYLNRCEDYLNRMAQGKPYGAGANRAAKIFKSYGIAMVVGLVVAAIVCMVFKMRMNTAVKQVSANNYVQPGGINITQRVDRYTHTTTSRVRVQSNNSSSGGGSSGSSGFSGSSGKF